MAANPALGPRAAPRLNSLRLTGARSLRNSRNVSQQNSSRQSFEYQPIRLLGRGAFGSVFVARGPDGEMVAVKKVFEDPRYKNRELDILKLMKHPNVVSLKHAFKSRGQRQSDIYLNLVMDYLPLTLTQFALRYRQQKLYPPILLLKIFMFQLFAGLHYMHSIGVTHRDVKPPNIVVDADTAQLKICDLGSAKILKPGERSVSYIASRFYRAPELIFGCTEYTNSIDVWAAGCVFAEIVMAGSPLFPGQTSIGQLHEIVKVIGPPTEEDLKSFQHDVDVKLAPSATTSLEERLPRHTPPDVLDLLKSIFVYNPKTRLTALQCMQHKCFDDLFVPGLRLPNKHALPPLNRHPPPAKKLPHL